MSGYWFSHGSYPITGSQSSSILDRANIDLIQAGFDKITAPTGYGNYLTKYSSAETGIVPSNVSVTDAGAMTITTSLAVGTTGVFGTGLTVTSGTVDFTTSTTKVATMAFGDNTTTAASTAFVTAAGLQSALPGQTGKKGLYVRTDGTSASWATIPIATLMGQAYIGGF